MSTTAFVISIEGRAQSTGESGQGLEASMTRLRLLSFAYLSMTGRSFCNILCTISFCFSAKSFWASSCARLRVFCFISICRLRVARASSFSFGPCVSSCFFKPSISSPRDFSSLFLGSNFFARVCRSFWPSLVPNDGALDAHDADLVSQCRRCRGNGHTSILSQGTQGQNKCARDNAHNPVIHGCSPLDSCENGHGGANTPGRERDGSFEFRNDSGRTSHTRYQSILGINSARLRGESP
jgi:hypothetical protein